MPSAAHASRLVAWADGERSWAADTHATQVLRLDDRARLAFRTLDLPGARELADLLAGLDRPSPARGFDRARSARPGMPASRGWPRRPCPS
ncbi:MAG: hypothetical protein ACK51M_13610 [Burkholderiales bacterium]